MKAKFLKFRIAQCLQLASLSPCTRRQFGAVIVNPDSNSILAKATTERQGDINMIYVVLTLAFVIVYKVGQGSKLVATMLKRML